MFSLCLINKPVFLFAIGSIQVCRETEREREIKRGRVRGLKRKIEGER